MTNHESDGLFDNDWEDRSELAWSEAEWHRYLADQEKAVQNYARAYDRLASAPDRLDQVARRLGWEPAAPEDAGEDSEPGAVEEPASLPGETWEPYTVHRNPVYIATKALYLGLLGHWERLAARPAAAVPAPMAIGLLGTLHRGHDAALQGIHALEMGDYTLAVCFFKRALREVNASMAGLNSTAATALPALGGFRDYATPRLFDLREIWLRVMNECRIEAEADDGGD